MLPGNDAMLPAAYALISEHHVCQSLSRVAVYAYAWSNPESCCKLTATGKELVSSCALPCPCTWACGGTGEGGALSGGALPLGTCSHLLPSV